MYEIQRKSLTTAILYGVRFNRLQRKKALRPY